MNVALSRRLAQAMDRGGPTLVQRKRIVAAAQTARTFDDLPQDVKRLVRRLEATRR